jgi:AcrR family transcriptional regulator
MVLAGPQKDGLRARKKERTRQDLLRAAVELFDEKGYEHTTVDDIVDRAEYSRSTFFRYFGSKEEVVIGHPLDALDTLRSMLGLHVDDPAEQDFELIKGILTQQTLDLTSNVPELEAACVRLWHSEPSLMASYVRVNVEAEREIARFLSRGRVAPGAEPDLESHAMAIAMIGVIRSAFAVLAAYPVADDAGVAATLANGFELFEHCWPPAAVPKPSKSARRGRAAR